MKFNSAYKEKCVLHLKEIEFRFLGALTIILMVRTLINSLPSLYLLKKALLAFLAIQLFLNSPAMGSQENEPKSVLILYSLGHVFPATAQWDRGIRSVFKDQEDMIIKVDTEHLDLSRYNDADYVQMMADIFRYKYSESKPDLIIAVFEHAFDFLLQIRHELFPDVPIIFGGLERISLGNRDLGPNITGVFQERIAYAKTFELALQLHPNTRHVVAIGGSGSMEQSWIMSARKTLQRYEDRVNITYITELPFDEIKSKIEKLPADTIILYFPILEDNAGKSYIAINTLSQISEASSVPVYSFWDVFLGHGLVGGYVKSFIAQGEMAAGLGIRILKGASPGDIPAIENNKLDYLFDWRQLKRWSISEDRLPAGSIVKFKAFSVWESHKGRIIGIVALLLSQALVIFYLIVLNRTRRRAEAEVQRAEQKYRTVADYTFDWEYWQNPDGSFQYVSPSCERISGITAQDLIANPSLLNDIVLSEDKDIWSSHACSSRKVSKPQTISFRIEKPDGEIRWIEHACQPVFDHQGNSKGVRASNRDITARESYKSKIDLLQSELHHMDRVITVSALTSALAHEINQPLAAMRSYAQAALRFIDKEQPEYDSVRKALQGIVADNKRAADVVNRLRNLVKKDSSRFEKVEISTIINDVVELINSEMVLRNVQVTMVLHERTSLVQGDSVQIQQVLINLLTNALDAMDDQPAETRTITISTRNDSPSLIVISVSDTGGGIPADKIDDVFTPFHTTKSEGMGLGLAISKSIIESHGGEIWVESNPKGGATFSFTLQLLRNDKE